MMRQSGDGQQQYLINAAVFFGGFLLFWEWLRPLEQVTDTEDVTIFILYAAFCFVLSFLQLPWYVSSPLKLLGMAYLIDGLFLEQAFLSKEWFLAVYADLVVNFEFIVAREWWEMTPFFRSLLFFILLWLMSYLLYYWLVIAKKTLFFIVITIIYITILDTFTVYEGMTAIIRTFAVSFVMLGLTSFTKEMANEKIPVRGGKRTTSWVVPLLVVVIASSLLGYLGPKFEPQWPDPVPFMESAAEGIGNGSGPGIRKVGYGENDSRLGGSFVQDDSPVFQVAANERYYWRVESKDFYTGKGWERTIERETQFHGNGELSLDFHSPTVLSEESSFAVVGFNGETRLPVLVYPYGISAVDAVGEAEYRVEPESGRIETIIEGNRGSLETYQLAFNEPSFSINKLEEDNGTISSENVAPYLQLPEGLPQRVKDLAAEITEPHEKKYEKVKAVERYFSSTGFEYDTTGIPVPSEDEDYVDQFLFESQVGYCDNFSTSMIVLLRSIDIPARWVKGFTGGDLLNEKIERNGEELNVYQVTNSNAHSWVEVWFEGVGWVPFEPTKGFINRAEFYQEVDPNETPENEGTEEPEIDPNLNDPSLNPRNRLEDSLSEDEASGGGANGKSFSWLSWILGILVVAGLVFGLYKSRFNWLSRWYLFRYMKKSDNESYQKAYHFLIKVLAHRGLRRKEGQTLREFAKEIDRDFQTEHMSRLTYQYEKILYRPQKEEGQWDQEKEIWADLLKRSLS
ncbi:transglutaminaseTgpA domain-containing protein [Bacillaceae bacterium S4-13-58]